MMTAEMIMEKVKELVAPLGAEDRLQVIQSIALRPQSETTSEKTSRDERHQRRQRQQTELDSWYALPTVLRQQYSGNYVALWEGKVVDYSPDQSEVYLRIRERFGAQPVVIIHADWDSPPVFTFHSNTMER